MHKDRVDQLCHFSPADTGTLHAKLHQPLHNNFTHLKDTSVGTDSLLIALHNLTGFRGSAKGLSWCDKLTVFNTYRVTRAVIFGLVVASTSINFEMRSSLREWVVTGGDPPFKPSCVYKRYPASSQ